MSNSSPRTTDMALAWRRLFVEEHIANQSLHPLTLIPDEIEEMRSLVPGLERICSKLNQDVDDQSLHIPFYSLIRFYRSQGFFNTAIHWSNNAIDILIARFGERHIKVLDAKFNLVKVLQGQHRLPEAEQLLLEIINIKRNLIGEENPDLLGQIEMLAVIYEQQGDLEKAEDLYKQVLNGLRHVCLEDVPLRDFVHYNIAKCLINLGGLYIRKRQVIDAISYLLLSRDLLFNSINSLLFSDGEIGKAVTALEQNIGLLFLSSKEYDEAETYLLGALELANKYFSQNDPVLSYILWSLGEVYIGKSCFEEAHVYFESAIKISEDAGCDSGLSHPEMLSRLADLKILMWSQDNSDTADKYLIDAYNTLIKVLKYPIKDQFKVEIFLNLGWTQDCLDNELDAIKYYTETLVLYYSLVEQQLDDRQIMARAHFIAGKHYLSESLYENAYFVFQKYFQMRFPNFTLPIELIDEDIKVIFYLGEILSKNKYYDHAADFYFRAYHLSLDYFGAEPEITKFLARACDWIHAKIDPEYAAQRLIKHFFLQN